MSLSRRYRCTAGGKIEKAIARKSKEPLGEGWRLTKKEALEDQAKWLRKREQDLQAERRKKVSDAAGKKQRDKKTAKRRAEKKAAEAKVLAEEAAKAAEEVAKAE